MICADCAEAADQQAGPGAHCDADGGPGSPCDCQHRTDRYRNRTTAAATGKVVIHVQPDPPDIAAVMRAIRRTGPGRR